MADFRTRRSAKIADESAQNHPATGLPDVASLQRRITATVDPADESAFYYDTLAEYGWARDVAGLAPSSVLTILKPVLELCAYFDCVPWRLTPRQFDMYFAGPGKRHPSTIRKKTTQVDRYFAFLEQRYGGEIARRFGISVQSPVDVFNRPHHRGDFALRIPPTQRAMTEFFAAWRDDLPNSRKYPVAARDYVMAKIAYISGVRAKELCAVRIRDVYWESGQWGRFIVTGKGRPFCSRKDANCCGGASKRCVENSRTTPQMPAHLSGLRNGYRRPCPHSTSRWHRPLHRKPSEKP